MSKCKCGHEHTEHGKTGRGPCEKVTDTIMLVVCGCTKYRKSEKQTKKGKPK
jgi:hypothetical protein